jgi:siroheme decarboxylase
MNDISLPNLIDDTDRLLIHATQEGLPVVARPYEEIAKRVGMLESEVIARLQRMKDVGVIRRVAAVPNHYAIGYRANGMSVWDVPDELVDVLGAKVGQLVFVSHCYRRPRHPPEWPYNLFAMVHGHTREEVERQVDTISRTLGESCRAHDVLYSTRILKKTGLRLRA